MTEDILDIDLAEDSFVLNRDGQESSELNLGQHWSILFIWFILNFLLVAEDHDLTLGSVRIAIFILDGHQAHGWYKFTTFMLD